LDALRVGEKLWDVSRAAVGSEMLAARFVVSWPVSEYVLDRLNRFAAGAGHLFRGVLWVELLLLLFLFTLRCRRQRCER
jgi:hypothetical protein